LLSEEEIFESYRVRSPVATRVGGELYLLLPVAFEFLETCRDNNLAVIGIEGFLYEGGLIHPQMDLIADFSSPHGASSWTVFRESCHEACLRFLALVPKDGLVSLVVMSEQEWTPGDAS